VKYNAVPRKRQKALEEAGQFDTTVHFEKLVSYIMEKWSNPD
jgi:hypothetical protein